MGNIVILVVVTTGLVVALLLAGLWADRKWAGSRTSRRRIWSSGGYGGVGGGACGADCGQCSGGCGGGFSGCGGGGCGGGGCGGGGC